MSLSSGLIQCYGSSMLRVEDVTLMAWRVVPAIVDGRA